VAGSLLPWRPRRLGGPTQLPQQPAAHARSPHQQQAVDLRHQFCTFRHIARVLAATLSTVGRTLKAMGLGRLKDLQPPVPVHRYQWDLPDDMIHVDIKQLARFDRVGHRITADRLLGRSSGAGFEKAHLAIDNSTWLAYAETMPYEKQATPVGLLITAVAKFRSQRITSQRLLSDNGSAYRSKPSRLAC